MTRFFILILLLAMPLTLPAMAAPQEPITIAAFGDSLVAGYGLSPGDAFPAQLQRKLRAGGYNVTVLNDGISGETTAMALARLDSVMKQKPAAAIVVLGANDLLQGLPPAAMKKNLAAIIMGLRQQHARILLAGLRAPPAYGAHYVSEYNAVFPDLAKAYGTGYYPVFIEGAYGTASLVQADGIHPNSQGVALIVDRIYPSVVDLIKPR